MLRVGLLAMGGSNWIAGVQYLHSILYGNSLLPAEEQAGLWVYLDRADHRICDFRQMRMFCRGMQVTEFSRDAPPRLYRKVGQITRTVVRDRRFPATPIFDLPGLLRKNETDVLFAGTFLELHSHVPQLCWIPDFQHRHHPEFFSSQERQSRDQHFARIMARADRVVVSNQCSYDDAVSLYPEHREKLAVLPFTMYLGSRWQNREVRSVLRKYKLPKKFLLFPGQFWKHKNHLRLFQAIELIRQQGHKDVALVCTGLTHDPRFPNHAAELRDFLVNQQLNGTVRLLGLLPRHEQVQLMRAATAIIQPSLFEGWSAVVEEARSLAKIVFASDIPMHREQFSDRVHLFDPTSSEAIANLVAGHWPNLLPGPDPRLESLAEADYHVRIRQFARQFIALCHGLVG